MNTQGRIHLQDLAKATIMTYTLVAALMVVLGCGGSQQGSAKGETTSNTSTSASEPLSASTQQLPPQGGQNRALPEHYEGLGVGEPAEFENELVVVVEGASLVQAPAPLPQLDPDDRLVAMRFSLENATPERQISTRRFKVTAAQWQALDQDGNPLKTIYALESTLEAGEIPNPRPDHPYLGWQGELSPDQRRQGSVLFAVPPSAKEIRARFTQPVMSPPFAEWELGTVDELPRAP